MLKCEIVGFGTHLKVADFEKSRRFYESLGFRIAFGGGDEAFRATLPEGVTSVPERFREINFKMESGAELEIGEDHVAIQDKGVFQERITSPKVSAMVRVTSLLPLFANPLVNIIFPVRHYYWGSIEAALRDPDGYVLVFIAPYSEEEFRRLSQMTPIEVIGRDDPPR